jgi:predicted PurR-regulated permease PerM
MKKKKNKKNVLHQDQVLQPVSHRRNYFLFFLLAVVLTGCFLVIRPYLNTIIIAMILAILATPVHTKISKLFKGRENIAALVSCILLTTVVVLPLLFMFLAVLQQGVNSFHSIYDFIHQGKYTGLLDHPFITGAIKLGDNYLPNIQKFFPDFDLRNIQFDKILLGLSASTGKILLDQGGQIAGNITALAGKFFLMIFTFFFFLRDEKKIFDYVLHLVPLSTSQEDRILEKIKTVAKSALLGTFVTAAAQGAAGGIAFAICGFPGLFWGMVMAFASLIPMVGTALVWIPGVLFLVATGHMGLAVFLTLWSVILVGGIDNVVRPLFMQGSADMNTLLIFFAILGGMNLFGLTGLLYGPLLFGLAMVLLYIYSIEYESFLTDQDNS